MNRCCQLSERVDFALAGCDPATGVRPSAGERILLTRKAAAKLVGNVRTTMRQFEVCLRHFIAWVQTDARLPHRANGSGGGGGAREVEDVFFRRRRNDFRPTFRARLV
jgi:hypothetical protein